MQQKSKIWPENTGNVSILLTVIDFAAELTSEDEDDPGLDGPDMDEILLSPASQIQLNDSVGTGNNIRH